MVPLHAALADEAPWIIDVEVRADELTVPPRIEAGQVVGFGVAMVKELLGRGDRSGGVRETVDRFRP